MAALTLDALNGDAGELRVRGKGARHDRLPRPHAVGDAIVADLRHGRPPGATRQVFVRMRAPRRGFANGHAVGTIVCRALARAGRHPVHTGAHLLRHSLATQLLQRGASLAEIGALVRHRNLETTRISAKVDQGALRARCRGQEVTHAPSHRGVIPRVLALPSTRDARTPMALLTGAESDALVAAPDQPTCAGRRDRTLRLVAVQTGLRVSEWIGLCWQDVVLGLGAHVRCHGNGRTGRCIPLRPDAIRA